MRWWTTHAILAGALIMSMSCYRSPEQSMEPAAVVERFFTALEAGDVDRSMALLDDEFVFRDRDSTFVVPKQAIPRMLAWDVAAGGEPVLSGLQVTGDTVRCEVTETNTFTELLGLEPYVLELTFVVREGRIREEVVRERVAEGSSYTRRFEEAVAPALAWAERNDPAALDRVLRDDGSGIRYDGDSAKALLEVIRAWREATTGSTR